MRFTIRLPAHPGTRYAQTEADAMVGARCYVGEAPDRREIGYIVKATRYNGGTVIAAEMELHSERDLLIAQMRAFEIGASLIP